MRLKTAAALALTAALAACGDSHTPTKLWEATGFQNPESALADTASGTIYVSNVAGGPADRDGNGYISKLSLDGKVTAEKWVTGLDSPKGLALTGGKLYVADLDKLVEIDVGSGAIVTKHEAAGAKILNDVAVDGEGRVYTSDWPGNAIWRLEGGTFEKWLESDKLANPNGLLVEGDKLIVAAWGAMEADFSTKTPGHLLTVSLADKTIADLGNGKPIGNLDGLEPFDADSYLVTDWVAGKVFQITRAGDAKELLSLGQGSADLGYIPATRTAIIPLMVAGKVVAYKF
ncbi:SMP-30/gluconolactonase/LRE family protein [Hyphomicrobium sp.]|uniref:SMP-30/gluconolactonase/LRE family protein n=1 Tax=Hyphomicrobium sp. TaxID=82 RepID=UPI003F7211C5